MAGSQIHAARHRRSTGRPGLRGRRPAGLGMVAATIPSESCCCSMSFDLLAPHYRWMEFLLAGEKLHRGRTAFLDLIPPPEKILLAGEGHGRCLVECAC